jgi:hypothetical protein
MNADVEDHVSNLLAEQERLGQAPFCQPHVTYWIAVDNPLYVERRLGMPCEHEESRHVSVLSGRRR